MALNERNAGGANGGAERDPRLDRLYRAAAGEAPPARLDATILAAARREVGARPRALGATLRRWHVPVSVAAVVIVSVSLVILVREEQAGRMEEAPAPAAARPADQAAMLRTQPTPAEAMRETTQPRPVAPPSQHQGSRDDTKFSAALSKREDSARRESEPPAASGVASGVTPAPAAKPSPQPFLGAPSRQLEERAGVAPADAVTAGRMAVAPAAATEPLVANSAPEAPQAKSMARGLAAKPSEQDRLPIWQGFEKEPPEKWLARIEELKGQGRVAEAEEMLSEFKRRFPGHPLAAGSK